MKYEDVLESYDGPLDLLYNLIEKEKIDIYDIPISKITEQYIFHINAMKELDLNVTSEFLVMASTLIEIKSKMLLPKTKRENQDSELEDIDPREELVKRLIEYKRYKDASLELKDRETTYNKIYYKAREEIEYIEDDWSLENVDLSKLVGLYENILERFDDLDQSMDYEEIVRDEVTIEESMRDVIKLLKLKHKVRFEELFVDNPTRSRVVTTFLAVLELIKQRTICIRQQQNFSEITVELRNIN